MANTMRYRRGDTNPVFLAPASTTVIEIGDLVYLDPSTHKPLPFSSQADQGSEAANQDLVQQYFLGVAEQQSRNGDTDEIRIATSGEFEFGCPSSTFNLGALVGASENSDGDGLEDQQVEAASDETHAIGVVARAEATAVTSVWIRIKSTVMDGGVQEQAATEASAS